MYYTIHFIVFCKLKDSVSWICDAIAPFPIQSIQKMSEHRWLLLLRKQLIVCREELSSLSKNYFLTSTISPYFNTPQLYKTEIINKIIACSETPFSKKLYRLETSQLICAQINWLVSIWYEFLRKVFSNRL